MGISALASEFGLVLQVWENEKTEIEKEQSQTVEMPMESGGIQSGSDAVPQTLDVHKNDDGKREPYLPFQSTAWSRRGKTKFFINADRIALFQFQIDSSYCHPAVEKCTLDIKDEKQIGLLYGSCAEFRRRKILLPVLETCDKFGVEILLLPEYSVRPETVRWMCDTMQKEGYKFSVWAGTFRIPAGYCFEGDETIIRPELNEQLFWHSAPLPVILNVGEKKPEIVIKKFKKYPAVALKEDINTTPAYVGEYSDFLPVMRKYVEQKPIASNQNSGQRTENRMPYFYDARDDVIELICAELFAVASISNYPSFLKESLAAYCNYNSPNLLEKPGVYEDYLKKYLKDLQEFGECTALYQRKKRYIRTPILLVPACATRAVDYYVFGQGFYLSAGLKTVFCNAVTGKHGGGSCFIGPDSWDDRKIKPDAYLMENTIYHGLKSGIFMQTSQMKNRGALGEGEQALLICDVYPELDKRSPNSESMMGAFSLVAHIPVFEERNYSACCKVKPKCRYCSKYEEEKAAKRREAAGFAMDKIKRYCEKGIVNSFSYDEGDPYAKKDMQETVKELKYLGETYLSDGFVERADYHEKYYRMYPQAWPSPALTGWLYVEIDYEDFFKESEKYKIQIPPKNMEQQS